MEQRTKREVVIDSDWLTMLGLAFALLVSLVSAVSDAKAVVHGNVRDAFSINTLVLIAVAVPMGSSFLWNGTHVHHRLFGAGLCLLGLGATTRAVMHFLHSSNNVQYSVAVGAEALGAIAWVMIAISAAQWIQTTVHVQEKP